MGTASKGIYLGVTTATAANLLADYEEGSWTPALQFGGAAVGMGATVLGIYTKIGRVVFFQGRVTLSDKGSSTGNALIQGLPFTSRNLANSSHAITIWNNGVNYDGYPHGLVGHNEAFITLYETAEGGGITNLTNSDFANTDDIIVTGHYIV